MSELGNKKAIRAVVAMAQDNLLLNKALRLMGQFIIENGIFNVTSNNKTQQFNAVLKYFKSEALSKLIEKGYEMGINTPWGHDVALLSKHRGSISTEDDDVELEYEEDEEEECDDEDDEDIEDE